MKKKTIFFEERFGAPIDEFSTTSEVDEFVERKTGRKLKIVHYPKLKIVHYPIRVNPHPQSSPRSDATR